MSMLKGLKKKKRLGLLSSAILGLTLFTAGCSGDEASSTKSKEGKADNGPFELSLMFNFDGVEFPKEGNEVEKIIEEMTNTNLKVNPLPGTAFEERLPVMVASGEFPDAVPIPRRHQQYPYVLNAVQGGVFWEIGPYLDQFPNLSKINKQIYENIKYDGKTYGVPRVRPMARRVFIYRQDWLQNLGMEEPKTIEDFHEMLRAFTFNDPDKNGKDDTYGIVMNQGQPFTYYAPFFGAPNKWEVKKDGKFVRDVTTDEFFESIKFQKQLYDEGLMNKDFTVIDRPEWTAAVETGKAGVMIDTSNSTQNIELGAQKSNPNAKFSMFSILENGKGKRIFAEGGHNGFFLFPKASLETEEELKKALGFFDKLASEEGSNLLAWGIEGVHYNVVDGKAEKIPDTNMDDVGAYGAPLATLPPLDNAMEGSLTPLAELELELTKENEKYMVSDPTLSIVSDTYLEMGEQLEVILDDAHVKFIMGEIDEKGWKAAVEEWKSRGGDKIAKEYEEAYKKAKAKK
ncbi:extracellular solute-binding protein [Neobacillus sp. 179-J 1A1 HS]|uniref:extracellular solute-binding protein n=1 Tax=Neobacillus driksii TaxID=3035913 RepID=UPI0035BBB559